jgi:hypothetical protein
MAKTLWRVTVLIVGCAVMLPAVALLASPSSGSTPAERKVERRLVGTWRLTSSVTQDSHGKTIGQPYGSRPAGKLTYTADRNMWAVVAQTGQPRSSPSTLWYTGKFHVDLKHHRIVHAVRYASFAGLEGGDQYRYYTLSGSRLNLATAPAGQPRIVLRWKKVS